MQGGFPGAIVHLAEDPHGNVLGWSYVTMQAEFMSEQPGAHLEVILVDEKASGHGIGKALLETSQNEAKARGAQSMTLHVWKNNQVARSIYEKNGFQNELMRYIKWF